MDLSITFITAIIVAITVLPFILMSTNALKRKRMFFNVIQDLATNHDSKITQHDFCGDFVIGIDETSKYLFFFKKSDEFRVSHSINLSEIRSCEGVQSYHTIKNKGNNHKELDKLSLALSKVNKKDPDILLALYDSDKNGQPIGELQLMEKWNNIINGTLTVPKENRPAQTQKQKQVVKVVYEQ